MVKQKFDPGDLIFGKVKGYPPWPARVTAVTSKDRYQKTCNENRMVDDVQICNFFSIKMTIVAYSNRQVQSLLLWDFRNSKSSAPVHVAFQSRGKRKVCTKEHQEESLHGGTSPNRKHT